MNANTNYNLTDHKILHNNYLDGLATELKVEIILHLSNPTPLARCSRAWYATVNSPATKARWLTWRYGETHALFHAVRMGEPFINVGVVECLFAQKAHLSRYFIQRVMLGFGKYDCRLIDLKLTHNVRPLDLDRKKIIQSKIRSPWASNLSFDVFSRILKEGHDRFDGNNMPVRGNDMESFYYLSAGPLVISEARKKLQDNINEIERLITTFRFAPFPSRRRHIPESTESRSVNYDDYPPADGYENVRQLNVIARAILIQPNLVNVWKKIGYNEIVHDVNDLVMQGSLLILYPPTPTACWVKPGLDQVVKQLKDLQNIGFKLTDGLIGDALVLFEHRLKDIGEVLIDAFVIVRDLNSNTILSTCLRELLHPDKSLKRHDVLDYILDRIDDPQFEIISALENYGIVDNNLLDMAKLTLHTRLQYTPIVYRYMLVKFGKQSLVTKHLMREIIMVKIATSQSTNSPQHAAESNTIFNEYYKAKVPFEPQCLQLIKTCSSDFIVKCVFEGYLAKLFNFKVNFHPPRTARAPDLKEVTPFMQANSKKRTNKHVKKEKSDLQQEWQNVLYECYHGKGEFTDVFRTQIHKFIKRLDSLKEGNNFGSHSKQPKLLKFVHEELLTTSILN
ncbi:4013_t:CDS:1 [Paraglomus brasilianum]|uniref:4013_t:CDS:1 n=1 Tax=Paraglomus brasilianum TaxID=144538 RepID=A0A9N9FRS6_9GLOM|nr:4013_t:CDS:1 [Paraglomus brasilianum]